MFKSYKVCGMTVSEQIERRDSIVQRFAQARLVDAQAAVDFIGRPDSELPVWWLEQRPHALPWLRHWID